MPMLMPNMVASRCTVLQEGLGRYKAQSQHRKLTQHVVAMGLLELRLGIGLQFQTLFPISNASCPKTPDINSHESSLFIPVPLPNTNQQPLYLPSFSFQIARPLLPRFSIFATRSKATLNSPATLGLVHIWLKWSTRSFDGTCPP